MDNKSIQLVSRDLEFDHDEPLTSREMFTFRRAFDGQYTSVLIHLKEDNRLDKAVSLALQAFDKYDATPDWMNGLQIGTETLLGPNRKLRKVKVVGVNYDRKELTVKVLD
jgi:hypothetical protein